MANTSLPVLLPGAGITNSSVSESWCDRNGHMSFAAYIDMFRTAADELWDRIGIGAHYQETTGRSLFVARCHIDYLQELRSGDLLQVETAVLRSDLRRIHVLQLMRNVGTNAVVAICELIIIHVDLGTRRSISFDTAAQARIDDVSIGGQLPPSLAGNLVLKMERRFGPHQDFSSEDL